MKKEQREATRAQIVKAALLSIAERGYDGVTTRYIASVAKVSQGLLTYHFKSKELLWRAAAEHLFENLDQLLFEGMQGVDSGIENNSIDVRETQRELIRRLVYFNAEHPELLRFMVQRGTDNDTRTEWLVDTHVKPSFSKFSAAMPDIPKEHLPHMFYAIAGASGVIFSVPLECERATGVIPNSPKGIKDHAEYLAYLFIPE